MDRRTAAVPDFTDYDMESLAEWINEGTQIQRGILTELMVDLRGQIPNLKRVIAILSQQLGDEKIELQRIPRELHPLVAKLADLTAVKIHTVLYRLSLDLLEKKVELNGKALADALFADFGLEPARPGGP